MTDTAHRRFPRFGLRLTSSRGARLVAVGGPLLTAGIAVAATFAGVSQLVRLPDWWGPWPLRPTGSSDGYGILEVVLLGCLCVLWTWRTAGLLRRPSTVVDAPGGSVGDRHPVAAVPALLGVGAACAIPLLVSGPIGSLDVQSYAAIGRLAALGLDPYQATPGLLADGYGAAVDPLWRWTPTPYGPLQVQLLRATVLLAGDRVGLAVLLIRGVAVAALVAAVVISLRAAQQRDRPVVLMLIVLNPVVLVHVISGAHLDVLIGALAVLVVWLGRRGQHATAVALAVVACAVKLPGTVLVAYVLVDVLRRTPRSRRMTVLPRTLGAGLASLEVVAALCPDPFGWVAALGVPGMVHNGSAPSTWMAYLTGLFTGHLVGPGLDTAFVIGRTATGAVGACAAAVLLWRATSGSARQAYHGVGWALLVLAATGPALYPWYLTWGLFAAALGSGARGRITLVALCSTTSVAAALGQGWAMFAVWSAVLLAVLGYSAWTARAVSAGDRADTPAVTAGLPYLIEQA